VGDHVTDRDSDDVDGGQLVYAVETEHRGHLGRKSRGGIPASSGAGRRSTDYASETVLRRIEEKASRFSAGMSPTLPFTPHQSMAQRDIPR
jgi:hypothetical protein